MDDNTKLLTKDVKPRKGEMIKPTELIAVKGADGRNSENASTAFLGAKYGPLFRTIHSVPCSMRAAGGYRLKN